MNTILLIPTGEGVGLTSACTGMIYALDCNGIKAGFLKPFLNLFRKMIRTVPLACLNIYSRPVRLNRLHMKELAS